jgi:tRNA(Arg) A34 adenosine deaminase TadA
MVGEEETAADPMAIAFAEAEAAAARDEVPVGAVLVDAATGVILARSGNRVEELHDPTAHAELLVIRAAAAAGKAKRLPGCDLYVTLEPCPMCAQAISFARIRRLYFGARDPKGGGVEHGPRISSSRPATTGRRSRAASQKGGRASCSRRSSGRSARQSLTESCVDVRRARSNICDIPIKEDENGESDLCGRLLLGRGIGVPPAASA